MPYTAVAGAAVALQWGVEGFRESVLDVVRSIPSGKVLTYGEVALLAGRPGAARGVGGILRGITDADGEIPWQRVINAQGGISTFKVGHGELQTALLRAEGVAVVRGKVDLRRFGWRPESPVGTRVSP